jgi:hypothetical protein
VPGDGVQQQQQQHEHWLINLLLRDVRQD